ncbi:MAG TPA: preprotein translocase subunit YajC [Chitinophagaceae bacterium]|nr:preprotein translocase subunit YajC [Chitinophagaceae bacterium]HRF18058.1 preprotein translocase subunit YajC [Chitinophagaceae bacterium]
MKSKLNYIAISAVIFILSSCTPPGGEQGKGGSSGGGTIQLVFLGLMILVFWLFFIRPQAKRAKNQKSFIENLGKGDKVVTIAGIHGVINKVNEDGTLNIEVSPGSYLKIEKSAISMDWTAALNKPATEKK